MSNISAQTKAVAAAVVAGVVVTMSALTVALGSTPAHAVQAAVGGAGDTSTQGPSPPEPPTKKAVPPLKSPKWHGGGWPGQ